MHDRERSSFLSARLGTVLFRESATNVYREDSL